VPGEVAGTIHPMTGAVPLDTQAHALSAAITATASAVASALGASTGAAAPAPQAGSRAADVIAVCKVEWPMNQADCSAFVRAVASALGVTLNGDADQIVNQIGGAGLEALANGPAAKNAADQGKLVIAGLAGANHSPPRDHGHVAVVVGGPLDPAYHRYPTGYWGTLNGVGEQAKTLNWAWRKEDRDHVVYAARTV